MGAPAVRELCEDGPEHRFIGDIPPARNNCTVFTKNGKRSYDNIQLACRLTQPLHQPPMRSIALKVFRSPQKTFSQPGLPAAGQRLRAAGDIKLVFIEMKTIS